MFPGGVKNKWVGFTCPLGPHLRMDNTCSPMSLIDDLLFDLFILGSYLVVHTYVHSVAGYFSKTIWNSPLCTLCTRALHGSQKVVPKSKWICPICSDSDPFRKKYQMTKPNPSGPVTITSDSAPYRRSFLF